MKSTVVVDVDAPPREVVSLFADPSTNAGWMHDMERHELVSGKPGMPGSVYLLTSKHGSASVTATIVKRFPDQLYLNLETDNVKVEVHGIVRSLKDGRTRLISNESIKFKGVWNKVYGVLASPVRHRTHRRHIEAFKEFVEQQRVQKKRGGEVPNRKKHKKDRSL